VRVIRDPFTGEARELRLEVEQPHGPPLIVTIRLRAANFNAMMKRVWSKERVERALRKPEGE
jgi:hypothetical protein